MPAAGTKGVVLRTHDGRSLFRVYRNPDDFTDYEIRHDELSVTIDADELASFYKVGGDRLLDHSPQALGQLRAWMWGQFDSRCKWS